MLTTASSIGKATSDSRSAKWAIDVVQHSLILNRLGTIAIQPKNRVLSKGWKIVRASAENECVSWLELGVPAKPNALSTLYDQHKAILQQIRRYVDSKGDYKTQGKKSIGRTDRVNGRFTRLKKLLTDHQREEERVLIPIVKRYFDSNACEVMRREHAHIIQSLQQLHKKCLKPKGSSALRRFTDSAIEFETIVRKQFSLEENVIYWFASLYLDQSRLRLNLTGSGKCLPAL